MNISKEKELNPNTPEMELFFEFAESALRVIQTYQSELQEDQINKL
ncbi:MAG: hypothetical protein N2558_01265 [Patescibacteria group bacterium]|nr:hypothetical protein [Patescibacteria group bacterium]